MSVWIADLAVTFPQSRVEREAASAGGFTAPVAGSFLAERDEDALTLALEAAHGLRDGDVGSLGLASTSLPYRRRFQAGLLAEALGLRHAFTTEHTTSSRSGTEALAAHVWRVAATGESALVVAAEEGPRSLPELRTSSAGAVALRLASEGDVASVDAIASAPTEAPGLEYQSRDASRPSDIDVPPYSAEILGALLTNALGRLGGGLADFTRVVLGGVDEKSAGRVLRSLGGEPAQWATEGGGPDARALGAAGPLVRLVGALDASAPGERILVVSYGAGSCLDLLALTAGAGAAGDRLSHALGRTRPLAADGILAQLEVL